ncbi:ATP-binding protein [Sphingomonas sp.]|uniref:ATP-binding protein n=1 Tax=Sphingomonas sp. TaxID=28214 RepID=UPI003B003842
MSRARPHLGLVGRLVAILLLAVTVEFGISTFLYERASRFSVRDDEARRLAEHLVIVRRLIAEAPPPTRARVAAELSTDRYLVAWNPTTRRPPPLAPALEGMRRQVVAWEPALASGGLTFYLVSPGRQGTVAGTLVLPDGGAVDFRTLQPVTEFDLAVGRVLLALVPALALMALGGLAVRRALLPLRQLAAAADRVGDGSAAGPPVPEAGPGEVASVIAAFNRMQGRIGTLIADRTQALAAVGHDLRTPLARLRLRAERVVDPERRAAMEGDVGEMEAMVASLLAYLGGAEEAEAPVVADLATICATAADDAVDHGHDVGYGGPDHLPMRLRRSAVKRALGNLVDNAVRFGNRVTITLTSTDAQVVIAVEDDGPGIDPALMARVREPFVRGAAERGRDTAGFGLGLAIVERMVTAEGGTLGLANRAAGGLRVAIVLPRNNSSQAGATPAKGGR